MNWPHNTILMMAERLPAKSGAERARDSRERWKLRRELGIALVDVGRLGAWDEGNRLAIDRARDRLVLDWVACVTSDGDDPVPRAMLETENKSTAHEEE